MTDIIKIADNFIGKDDREKLESFGGHTIALGRATRWHWSKDVSKNDVFEIYIGGANEELAAYVKRDRKKDIFMAFNSRDNSITSGTLEHVMAELDHFFQRLHHEPPDTSA
ncbi:MAG: hypothetical protein PVJ39_05710 [Gammaproteobacteria bacterium]|jgi:hypothetical protein